MHHPSCLPPRSGVRFAPDRYSWGCAVNLKVSTRKVGEVVVVDCSGRIVFGEEAAALRDHVKLLASKERAIVLNLGEVNYIDSGGLGTMVGLYTSVHNAGGELKLANLTQRVGDLLQVTKLLTVFEVHDSVEKSVASFSKAATV